MCNWEIPCKFAFYISTGIVSYRGNFIHKKQPHATFSLTRFSLTRNKGWINEDTNTANSVTNCKQVSLKPSPQTMESPTSSVSLPPSQAPQESSRSPARPSPQLPYSQSCRQAAQPPPPGAEDISHVPISRMTPPNPCSAWERSPGCNKIFGNQTQLACESSSWAPNRTSVPRCVSSIRGMWRVPRCWSLTLRKRSWVTFPSGYCTIRTRVCQAWADRPGTAEVFGRCISKINIPTSRQRLPLLLRSCRRAPALTLSRFLPSFRWPVMFRSLSFQDSCWEQLLLNVVLWKPKAGVALQSEPQISVQKAGASLKTLSVLVIAPFGGGVCGTQRCTEQSRNMEYLYSFTLKPESLLCSSPQKSEKV